MRFPITSDCDDHTLHCEPSAFARVEKFRLVMMLEPLHACNLDLHGCGRIREYAPPSRQKLTLEQCLHGLGRVRRADCLDLRRRPTDLPPSCHSFLRELLTRDRHVYLCTHGMFLRKTSSRVEKPSSSFLQSTSTWTASNRRTT